MFLFLLFVPAAPKIFLRPQLESKSKLIYCKEQKAQCFRYGKTFARYAYAKENNFTMPSTTIDSGLKKYAIGPKLRRLRLRKGMGLIELGKHTGLSPAMLSKLERGVMHPTLPTLLRIAMVFSVGLEYFFSPSERRVVEVIRKKDRLRFPATMDAAKPPYHFESLDFPVPERKMNSYFAEFAASGEKPPRPHEHPGVEFLFVLSGALEINVNGEALGLFEGDAIYFDSSVPHYYRASGSKRTTALVVTS